MIEKHKVCFNCGALMTWDIVNEMFVCHYCGNSESTKEELKSKQRSYIN